jgi:hypothetical protein
MYVPKWLFKFIQQICNPYIKYNFSVEWMVNVWMYVCCMNASMTVLCPPETEKNIEL